MNDSVHFILTGGTIEKIYDPVAEKLEFREASILPSYFDEKVKVAIDVTYETVCQIDSLDMCDHMRMKIKHAVDACPLQRIVIIHGTSTMEKTAAYLAENSGDPDKTVVFTGAMIPLKEFAMSDAGFNLGYALAQAQSCPPGVYVCMNARTFRAGEVTKNTKEGRFQAV